MPNDSSTGGYLVPIPLPNRTPIEDQILADTFQALIVGVTGIADPTLIRPLWQDRPPPLPANNINWVAFGIVRRVTEAGTAFVGHQSIAEGYLAGAQLSQPINLAPFEAITNGGFKIALNGGSFVEIDGLNFSVIQSIGSVAQQINAALSTSAASAASCYWNGYQFLFMTTTGATPSIAVLTPPTTGGVTDVSGLLGCNAASNPTLFSGTMTDDELRRHEELDIRCSFYGPNADAYAGLLRDGLQIGQNREALQSAHIAFIEALDNTSLSEVINKRFYYRVDQTFRFRREIVRTYQILNIASAKGALTASNANSYFTLQENFA